MDLYQTLINSALGGGGGGGSSYELLAREEFEVSTTSTSAQSVGNVNFASADTDLGTDRMYYVRIYDKAGNRKGHFCEYHRFWFRNTGNNNVYYYGLLRNDDGNITLKSNNAYGVYCDNITTGGGYWYAQIKSKYSATTSLTIDGTYVVEVYRLAYSNNESPTSRCVE